MDKNAIIVAVPKKGSKLSLKTRNSLIGLGFVSIWIVGFCVLTLYPIVYTLYLSFHKVRISPVDGIMTEFMGWENYRFAFQVENFFGKELSEYFSEMLAYIPVIIVASLVIALLLNTKFKGVGIFRTVFFLPVIITSGPVIKQFLDQGVGSVADIVKVIDLTIIYDTLPEFLANTINFLISQFTMILWFSGVQILIYLAGLKKLDSAMYEAAKIDGAGKWETFWKLTLPAINPMIVINVIYTVVTQSMFPLSAVVLKIAGEMNKVETGYGYSAALAYIYTIAVLFVLAVTVLLFYRRDKKVKITY